MPPRPPPSRRWPSFSPAWPRVTSFTVRCPTVSGAALVCAVAPSIDVMLAGRLLQGLGCGAGVVLANAVVRDLFDSTQTAKVMKGLIMVLGLSPILAQAIGAGILHFASWRTVFWVLFVFTALVGARTFVSLRESRSAETALQAAQERPFRTYLLLLRRRLMGYFSSMR